MSAESRNMSEQTAAQASAVARHYNKLPEKGLIDRSKSRIYYMRNYNNWTKAVTITDILQRIKSAKRDGDKIRVLDLCCGKGGDLLKWKQGRIDHLVCADIAEESVQQCQKRYSDMIARGRAERFPPKEFTAQFITADCSKQRLKDLYNPTDIGFDLCSCQFSYHYSFESFEQADMMLRNACECLIPGGYFIASTTNSYELVKRLKASETTSFGNHIYKINFDSKESFPLFGCKYDFTLDEVVNCPEFLVYFPVLEEMAKKYKMKLVFCKRFSEIFDEYKTELDPRHLLGRMEALEAYPADEGMQLSSDNAQDYEHIQKVYEEKFRNESRSDDVAYSARLGTLSMAEWQVSNLYIMFAFRKL